MSERVRNYVTPGRVEFVGKHVDYAAGRSATCAVGMAVRASARPISEPVLSVRSLETGAEVRVPIHGSAATPAAPDWATYVAAVARRIGRDFPGVRGGVAVEFRSDLPIAAGLSSSTALTITFARALLDASGIADEPLFREHAGTPLQFAVGLDYHAPTGMLSGGLFTVSLGLAFDLAADPRSVRE